MQKGEAYKNHWDRAHSVQNVLSRIIISISRLTYTAEDWPKVLWQHQISLRWFLQPAGIYCEHNRHSAVFELCEKIAQEDKRVWVPRSRQYIHAGFWQSCWCCPLLSLGKFPGAWSILLSNKRAMWLGTDTFHKHLEVSSHGPVQFLSHHYDCHLPPWDKRPAFDFPFWIYFLSN